ncbi:hypothetical protein K435DRAFT_842443 [Dendrothele bispora CBS 962.96]|uniref:F-box domain-containing protein n=1 Tax=Dendrothele bispora (strain CBS 962.96) TaxID=1314807 RepID=A0A4S8LFM6_DENBC|nr:hypothetical protein K435DRAFT_842443 [Dendrothele bispora CBS 962.96]
MSDSTTAINHLPDEILRKILQLAIRGTFRIHPSRQLSAFSSVNHHWRSLCFNSSELWTDIRIIYNELSGKVDLGDWTHQWLERSHPRLVDIYLDIPVDKFISHARTVAIYEARNVISVLMKHLDRIRSLTTGDDSDASYSGLLALIDYLPSATHLEHLDLRFLNFLTGLPSSFVSMDNVIHAGVVLPNLRSQKLKRTNILFPLERLTSVEIHFILPDEDSFRQMARMCPTLERLTLRSLYSLENPLPSGAPPIPMPSLRFLSVESIKSQWGSSPQKSILSILSAPNLYHLRIHGSPGTPHPRNVLPPLASFPSLHTLRLDHFEFVDPIHQNTLIDPTYFREPSSVKHLQLVHTSGETLFPAPPPTPKVVKRSRSIDRGSSPDTNASSTSNQSSIHWHWHRELGSKKSFNMPREITLPLLTPGRDERDTTTSTNNTGDLIRDLSTTTAIPSPFISNSLPTGPIPFPSLETLTLDSIRFQDVMWLCELVANRQSHVSCSSSIKRVYLSKSSMKHLRTSFTLEILNLKDKSNSNTTNSGSSGRGKALGLEGLTTPGRSTAGVNSDSTSPATVVARVKGLRSQFTARFSGEIKEEEEEEREKGKGKDDDGFTLERWLRDRVDVCELDMENENEEDEDV